MSVTVSMTIEEKIKNLEERGSLTKKQKTELFVLDNAYKSIIKSNTSEKDFSKNKILFEEISDLLLRLEQEINNN